jgi:hypothetical protein
MTGGDVVMITDAEMQTLICNYMRCVGRASEEDLHRLGKWAHAARIEASLLELALSGEIGFAGMDPEDGPIFRNLP